MCNLLRTGSSFSTWSKARWRRPPVDIGPKCFSRLHLEAHLNRLSTLCLLSQIGSKDQDVKLPAKMSNMFQKVQAAGLAGCLLILREAK